MKKYILILALLFFINSPVFAFTTWENSPNNWNNSVNNWQNSPNNWNNSINNPNANIIYDSNGTARGYAVPKSNGTGMNIYDFNGNRNGYFNY